MEETEDEKVFFGYYRSLFEPFKNNYDYLFNDNDKKSKFLDDGDKEYKLK
jgi:hypothetical protein